MILVTPKPFFLENQLFSSALTASQHTQTCPKSPCGLKKADSINWHFHSIPFCMQSYPQYGTPQHSKDNNSHYQLLAQNIIVTHWARIDKKSANCLTSLIPLGCWVQPEKGFSGCCQRLKPNWKALGREPPSPGQCPNWNSLPRGACLAVLPFF